MRIKSRQKVCLRLFVCTTHSTHVIIIITNVQALHSRHLHFPASYCFSINNSHPPSYILLLRLLQLKGTGKGHCNRHAACTAKIFVHMHCRVIKNLFTDLPGIMCIHCTETKYGQSIKSNHTLCVVHYSCTAYYSQTRGTPERADRRVDSHE